DVLAAAISDEASVAAEPQHAATPVEHSAERVEPIQEVSEPSPETLAPEQAPGETFALVAEGEPVADAEEHEPAAAPVMLGETDQFSLPLSPAPPDTPVHESPREEES